jgi:NADP-dependent aldehyde dehydrogenase
MQAELHGRQLIAGSAVASEDSPRFHGTNPSNGQKLSPDFHEATRTEVDRACRAAEAAAPAMRKASPQAKAKLLRAMAERIMGLGDALVTRATEETGLPRPRIEMERGRTCNQLKLFADVVEEGSWVDARIDHAIPDRQPSPSRIAGGC